MADNGPILYQPLKLTGKGNIKMDDSFLSSFNATFIAEMYQSWSKDPSSVEPEWVSYFQQLDDLASGEERPDWGVPASQVFGAHDPEASIKAVAKGIAGDRDLKAVDVRSATLDSLRALMLIRAYRTRGHLLANLDPLNLTKKEIHPELDPATYGFQPEDYDRPIFINYVLGLESTTLDEIFDIKSMS